jgi:hypothetical protein
MSEGAFMELVARGKKDAYFIQDAEKTFFGTPYTKRSPSTLETYYQETEGPAIFGQFVDIEIPRVGDFLTSVEVRIQMPTWLPSDIAALNKTIHRDASGNYVPDIRIQSGQGSGLIHYGWTNGIANFLIKRWVLRMDSIEIQEGFGDYNDWQPLSDTTHLKAPVLNYATGSHDGAESNIQRNATPPYLTFKVPIVGCDGIGLPLAALKGQRLVLRLFLNSKELLVESGTYGPGDYEICPEPWGGHPVYVNGVQQGITADKYAVGNPHIRGRFEIVHVDEELRQALQKEDHAIVYKQQRRQDFVLDDSMWPQGQGLITNKNIRIDLQGLFQRLFLGLTSYVRTRQNKYRDLSPPIEGYGSVLLENREYLSSLSVSINSQERISPWATSTFQELSQNLQMTRDITRKLYFIVFGVSPDSDGPGGAINLARTQKAVLNIALNNILPDIQLGSKKTLASLMGDAWNILDIKGGIATVRYMD